MKNKFLVIILLLLLVTVYWQWFLPGARVANDFPIISESLLKSSMNLPFVWSESGAEGLGEYSTFFLWSWPLSFIAGILANIGLGFSIIERVLLFIPFLLLGGIGIWKFCGSVKLTDDAKFIASLFYLTTTYILLVIDGGQLSIALTYAWFPIAFLAVEKSIKGGFNKKVFAGLSVSILGFFDFRFIYVLFLLSLVLFFYQLLLDPKKRVSLFLDWISSGVIIGTVVLGLNIYWLLPLFKAPISSGTYAFFTQASFLSLIDLGHSILLLAPHWFKNVFGNITTLRPEFVFIPILVFLAPILRPKDRVVGFWLLVSIFSIFLTKGASEPLPQIYPWLFSHIPGFSLFRDSSKFFFLEAFSYSVLLGITTDEILKKAIKFPKLKIFFLIILSSYFIFLIRPVWFGQMTGTFSQPLFQQEFAGLSQFIEKDKSFSRVFWIPSFPSLGYSSLTHPRIEAARLVQRRTFAIGTLGTYEIFNFLREAQYMGEIFDVAGIEYIAYPYLDPRRDNLHPDNVKYQSIFSDQLSKLSWLSKVENSLIPLWKVKQHQDKFFITQNIWWVIGSDDIYKEATKSSELALSKNSLIFVEEFSGLGKRIDELPNANIVLNNKTFIDFSASFIDSNDLIFPAKKLKQDPDQSGWWKREAADLIRWREFLQIKYGIDNQDFDLGGGWAVGEGEREFTIYNLQFTKGKVLLARVLESTRSGNLSFSQDGKLIGQIDTKKPGNNIRWFEVGQLQKDGGELEIKSSGDINVVNALSVLDKVEWVSYQDKTQKLQGRIVNFDEKNIQSDNNPKVSYNKINPTKYIVDISGLTKPAFLVFSQSYDGLWKMNGQTFLPVYSLLNGFKIEKNGQYTVEFEPQKYVFPGLLISTITAVGLILLLIRSSKHP
ncbi:MAG: Uncharacterized protein G01um10147_453 [Microgenomates group bacterium Gr01-1014_7]|nr:MAG: Uncharacterized protein G01um10147_453 [Microgenomates group bacterium Gr01-1014_7]